MAKVQIPLEYVPALFAFAQGVKSGAIDVDDARDAFIGLERSLSRLCEVQADWVKTGTGTEYISGLGWKVEYNPGDDHLDERETVLYNQDAGTSFWLSGDHREAFKEASVHGLDSMLDLYVRLRDGHGGGAFSSR